MEPLAPSGYVRVYGELWKAKVVEDEPSIGIGERVRVRGIEGLRLQVEREQNGHV
jgi:membrane protein implicated in regulation of membrane protease activity